MTNKPNQSRDPSGEEAPVDRGAATICPAGFGEKPTNLAADPPTEPAVSNQGDATLEPAPRAPDATSLIRVERRPSPQKFQPGRILGDYELLQELARGGMGVVFKAKHKKLNRIVALKMILAGELATASAMLRFRAEAEAAANLDHPGIVPIYEVGEIEGRQFFSMGFIDGGSLADRLKNGPLPNSAAAGLMIEIAEAVQYAHERGVVHRDLKPANILLATASSDSTTRHLHSAIPKITDFGLAKRMESAGHTATGEILGTPSYMPPEQASGKIQEIGPLSDVYSLGALLYATITGRPPFQAASVMDTLVQVLEREPLRPSALNPAVDRDLETICLKAMEKQPLRRYPSAVAFADDLRRYLANEPIVARRISATGRGLRWCRRNRTAAAAFSVVGLMIAGLIVGGPIIAVRERSLRDDADEQRVKAINMSADAEVQREEATKQYFRTRQVLYANQMQLADREFAAGHVRQAKQLLEKAEPAMIGWEWRYLQNRLHDEEYQFAGHAGECRELAFDPAGRKLFSVGDDGRLRIWDLRDTKILSVIDAKTPLRSLALHPVTGLVAALTTDGKLLEIDSQKATVRSLASAFGVGERIVFNRVGNQLAVALENGEARIYSWPLPAEKEGKPKAVAELRGPPGRLHAVAFSPDDKSLAVCGQSTVALLFDIATGKMRHVFAGHRGEVFDVAFSPDGKTLATGCWDTWIRLWDTENGRQTSTLRGADFPIESIQFSPEGDRLVSASYDGAVRVWDLQSEIVRTTFRGHGRRSRSVKFSPVDQLIASCCADGDIRLWDATTSRSPRLVTRFLRPPAHIAFDSRDRSAAIGTDDRSIALIDVESGRTDTVMAANSKPMAIRFVAASNSTKAESKEESKPLLTSTTTLPDAVLAVMANGRLLRWDPPGGEPAQVKLVEKGTIAAAAFDGDALAFACSDGSIWFAAKPNEKPGCIGRLEKLKPASIAVSADLNQLAVGCAAENGAGALAIFRMYEGVESAPLLGETTLKSESPTVILPFLNPVMAVGFDARHKWWVVGDNREIAIVDPNGKPVQTLEGHTGAVWKFAFAPDGNRLLSASTDGVVKFWDLDTMLEILTLPEAGLGVAMSHDGQRLLSGFWDSTLKLWSTAPRTEMQRKDAMMARSVWAGNCETAVRLESTLMADPALDAERKASLRSAFAALPKTAFELNSRSWRVVGRPLMSQPLYANADRMAQMAYKLVVNRPDRADYVNTAGVAKYRIGDFAAAITLLEESDAIYRKQKGQSRVADLAFLAMAYLDSGNTAKADAAMKQLRDWKAKNKKTADAESRRLFEEANARFASRRTDR